MSMKNPGSSGENFDPFDQLMREIDSLGHEESQEAAVDAICEDGEDPIQCAKGLYVYVREFATPEKGVELVDRGGTNIWNRFQELFEAGPPISIKATGGMTQPESNPAVRKRDVIRFHPYDEPIHVIGKLSGLSKGYTTGKEPDDMVPVLGLIISEPYLIDEFGDLDLRDELPDYMFVQVDKLTHYELG